MSVLVKVTTDNSQLLSGFIIENLKVVITYLKKA